MTQRIVHLGVGNFHRAHQAWYTQHANQAAGTDWRITGVSLRRPDMRDALKPQGYVYTLEIDDGSGPRYETVSVIDGILVAPEDAGGVAAAIGDAATALVTLTITEKGYGLRSSDWRLDLNRPDTAADLQGSGPTTAVGFVVAGLARRHAVGLADLTVLCCDNLPDNGKVLGRAVDDFARAKDPALADWIAANVAFPSCMVDRITPATTDELRQRVATATDKPDAWPVATEGFSQWVIEDRFSGPRPAWERAGAELVPDVRPYELRKLRMLNGAHSTLAYAGRLAGHEYVH
jgi:fructuronate reductase